MRYGEGRVYTSSVKRHIETRYYLVVVEHQNSKPFYRGHCQPFGAEMYRMRKVILYSVLRIWYSYIHILHPYNVIWSVVATFEV